MVNEEIVTQNLKNEITRRLETIKALAENDSGAARRGQEELFSYVLEMLACESITDHAECARMAMAVWDIEFYDCGCSSNWTYADIGLDLKQQIEVVKEYKYLIMSLIPRKNKTARTDKFLVTNKNCELIGLIYWRNGFRKYVFSTHTKYSVDLSVSCMNDICSFISDLMEARKQELSIDRLNQHLAKG